MTNDSEKYASTKRKQEILSLEHAIQLLILLAVGLLAFSFL